jgi:hypothetical protein
VRRSDGSYIVAGNAIIYAATGGQTRYLAVEALTPAFTPDLSFGGPALPLGATLRLPRQRATTDRSRRSIRVTLRLSTPGLCRVVIKHGGRIVAASVLSAPSSGPSTQPVKLTGYGSRLLRHARRLKVTADAQARDLLTNKASTSTYGVIR